VGSEKEISVDMRIISASHKNLETAVANGDFRQDLYYRLNVIDLAVPALRERRTDIPMLIAHFLQKNHQAHYKISDDAQALLDGYHFPGNVRELENILQRAVTLCDNNEINTQNIQLKSTQQAFDSQTKPALLLTPHTTAELPKYEIPDGHNLETYLEEIERSLLLDALESCRWNRTVAAEKLGISFRSIRYRLKKLNID
jgi:two-component system, NtrC family, response regulator PilR